jgi:hypothetical protein
LHKVGKWVWIFNLEALKFLMHFRESESSLYFIFTHTHIFSFSIFLFAPLEF